MTRADLDRMLEKLVGYLEAMEMRTLQRFDRFEARMEALDARMDALEESFRSPSTSVARNGSKKGKVDPEFTLPFAEPMLPDYGVTELRYDSRVPCSRLGFESPAEAEADVASLGRQNHSTAMLSEMVSRPNDFGCVRICHGARAAVQSAVIGGASTRPA